MNLKILIKKNIFRNQFNLIIQTKNNINLKNKFHEYQKRFKDYKEEHLKKQNHFHEIYYKHKKKKEIT